MKANELMIGDYFNVHPSNMAIRVAAIHKGKVGYHACTNKLAWVRVDLLRPIPLTPEIFEKNGFERCVNSISRISVSSIPICESNQFANKEFGGNTRIIDMGTHGFTLLTDVFGMTNKNKVNHLFYLHELQHALRLCGIDKTITL